MNEINFATVKNENFEIEYFSFGRGEKNFVIIPGVNLKSMMPSANSVADAFRDFADEYKVYLFDRKKTVENGYTVTQMAEDTAKAIRLAGIEKCSIFGTSQGGIIGLYIAGKYPELVEKLVVSSTSSRADKQSVSIFSKWLKAIKNADPEYVNHTMFSDIYSKEYLEKYHDVFAVLEKEGTAEEFEKLEKIVSSILLFDITEEVEKIKCPTFILGSKKDAVFGFKPSEDIAEMLNCKLYIYENYSHAVYDEAEDFRPRILSFLKEDLQ